MGAGQSACGREVRCRHVSTIACVKLTAAATAASQTLSRVWTVEYDWPPFCIALGMSVVGMFVGAALEHIARALLKRPLDPVDPLEVHLPVWLGCFKPYSAIGMLVTPILMRHIC
jgi:hypothetical protein